MDPKTENEQPVLDVEVEVDVDEPQPQSRPAALGRMQIARLTPEQLAARRKADEEEEAKKREARLRPRATAPLAPPSASPTTAPLVAAVPAASAPTQPNALPSAPTPAKAYSSAQGPILAQLMDAAMPLLGAEGKHLSGLCALAKKLAQQLGATPEALELVPCAVQALYVASQLDRRGPYTPPESETLVKLLGPTWKDLGPLVEPCAKGLLSKSKFERPETAAIAAAVCFFNQTRNVAPPAQAAKAALTTLRNQKWIPADALDALATAVAG
jgi:hypothetical protein